MFKILPVQNEDGSYDMNFVMKLPEQFEKQYEEFFALYEIIDIQPNILQQVSLRHPHERTCRFCKKSYPEVSFKKKAHIIPELMGRNKLVSDFECDTCNLLFSKYETDLAYFIGAPRSLTSQKAKEGVPTYKSADKKLIIRTNPDVEKGGGLTIESENFDNRIVIDEDNKKVKINADRPSHVPLKAYKALVKILLTLLPDEAFSKYAFLLQALLNLEDEKTILTGHPMCRAMIYVNPGIPFPSPLAIVMEKKDAQSTIPTHSMVLYFHNYIYQIFLPFYTDDKWLYDGIQKFTLFAAAPMVDETFVEKFGAPKFYSVDLSANTLVKKQKHEIVMSYTSINKLTDND